MHVDTKMQFKLWRLQQLSAYAEHGTIISARKFREKTEIIPALRKHANCFRRILCKITDCATETLNKQTRVTTICLPKNEPMSYASFCSTFCDFNWP